MLLGFSNVFLTTIVLTAIDTNYCIYYYIYNIGSGKSHLGLAGGIYEARGTESPSGKSSATASTATMMLLIL